MSNLNQVKEKPIKVELGGKERTIKYDLNALSILEEEVGSIEKLDEYVYGENGISIKAIRKVLWAGLIHENEDLTEKEVGSWFDLKSLDLISNIIKHALGQSLPEKEESEGEDGEKKDNQTQE